MVLIVHIQYCLTTVCVVCFIFIMLEIFGRTYARTEATYGIANEFQVGIGESTCSGIFSALPIGYGGKALLSIDELSRISLERCNTSRCAVQLMGDLATEYGFYGVSVGIEVGAESLIVNDPEEVFVFHILPDDTGTSAVWIAQRVPDNHVAVVANMFVVRLVNLSDTFNFLGSENMFEIAKKHGLWNESMGLLDFTATFSDGEYGYRFRCLCICSVLQFDTSKIDTSKNIYKLSFFFI